MRRTLTVLVLAVFLVVSTTPAAHAGGHGRDVIGLAAFALFAPFIIVGEVLAHAVPRVVVAPPAVYAAPVYQAPPVAYAPAPVYSAPAYSPPPPAYAPPPPAYAPPPPAYAPPPAAYAPPPAYAQPVSVAPPPARQQVVQYSTGRYVLRGDGVVAPYRWVWIPNPPAGPPPVPPAYR